MINDQARQYLLTNWDTGICGTGLAAKAIGMNPDTLKTKVAAGRAPAMKVKNEKRQTVTFTGRHLVQNFILEKISQNRVDYGADLESVTMRLSEHIKERVLEGKDNNMVWTFWGGENPDWSEGVDFSKDINTLFDDAVVVVPVSKLIQNMARVVYLRNESAEAAQALKV